MLHVLSMMPLITPCDAAAAIRPLWNIQWRWDVNTQLQTHDIKRADVIFNPAALFTAFLLRLLLSSFLYSIQSLHLIDLSHVLTYLDSGWVSFNLKPLIHHHHSDSNMVWLEISCPDSQRLLLCHPLFLSLSLSSCSEVFWESACLVVWFVTPLSCLKKEM